jgi:AAA15 family ATPase/GTPase
LTRFRNRLGNLGNLQKSELDLIDNLVDLLPPEFLIYSPEIYSLQTFQKEGQIQPLGIHGEGLFKLLKVLKADKNHEKISTLKEKLRLIDWFKDFEFSQNGSDTEHFIKIKDRYLEDNVEYFDRKSSKEGFLFLLFYFALFISDDTPKFFAIDNIDASLNPRLCRRVMQELIPLAQENDKQVIFTTHNPAILDGLNLEDEEQKLYVIYRNLSGHTKAKQIFKPEILPGKEPVKLSEAFLRGYLGGLPKNF